MNRSDIEQKLAEIGLKLPAVAAPVASYVPARRTGTLVHTSGQLPIRDGSLMAKGVIPGDVTEADGQACAAQASLNAVAACLSVVGEHEGILGVVRVGVWVASAPGFAGQPGVANGASELLVSIFGEAGKHARAAVGSVALPLKTPVEVEVLFEVG
ncbi:MAG: RidA family protein [Planctomycetota bacterium]